jgi:hypothetical protein
VVEELKKEREKRLDLFLLYEESQENKGYQVPVTVFYQRQ